MNPSLQFQSVVFKLKRKRLNVERFKMCSDNGGCQWHPVEQAFHESESDYLVRTEILFER